MDTSHASIFITYGTLLSHKHTHQSRSGTVKNLHRSIRKKEAEAGRI